MITFQFCKLCEYRSMKPDITGLHEKDVLTITLGCLFCIFGTKAQKFIETEELLKKGGG